MFTFEAFAPGRNPLFFPFDAFACGRKGDDRSGGLIFA